MQDCIFCKIIKGEAPAAIVKESSNLLVFKNIDPKAPTHLLIVPKKHVKDIKSDNGVIWAAIGKMAVDIAHDMNISDFRLVHNAGGAAIIPHYHVHFLGEVKVEREL